MRILLSNDDGIDAPGIEAMHRAITGTGTQAGGASALGGEVMTVAPLTHQSATGHGVTFHRPMLVERKTINNDERARAVDGRPADCVKVALTTLWPGRFGEGSRPDLCVSGINLGANCGINVIYSGTVAAALEAAFLGVPAIAISLLLRDGEVRWDIAGALARRVLDRLIEGGVGEGTPLPPHACLNVNLPVCEEGGEHPLPDTDGPLDIAVCPMNTHGLVDAYEAHLPEDGGLAYFAAGHGLDFRSADVGTDVAELMSGKVTVTPLWYDLTDRSELARWRDRLG